METELSICSRCKKSKLSKEFDKNNQSKKGLRPECKSCRKLGRNREKEREYSLNYYYENTKDCKETRKNWGIENKEYLKKYQKQYYQNNINLRHKQYQAYYKNNREEVLARKKKWSTKNKGYLGEYANRRYKEDIQFKLTKTLRNRIRSAIKNNQKSGSAVKDLGCSIVDLKWWLEFWWEEGMNWHNHGNKKEQWSIDHIKPLSKFDLTDRVQFLEACNYKNLQPMWHEDNIKKGNK